MNKEIIKGKWKELKGHVKQQWAELTDDDILKIEGNADELSGLLQKKYGYAKDRAEKEIDAFVEKNSQEKSH